MNNATTQIHKQGFVLPCFQLICVISNTTSGLYTKFIFQFSQSVMSDSLWFHGLQHARFPCPSPTPRACSNSCPSSWWYHPTISSSAVPFSSCLQSFPASGFFFFFPMSQFFPSCGQSIGASASTSVLPMNIQDWFPFALTGWISLQSKGLSRTFSNNTVLKALIIQCLAFFIVQLSHPYMTTGNTIALTIQTLSAKWYLCFLICCLGLSSVWINSFNS